MRRKNLIHNFFGLITTGLFLVLPLAAIVVVLIKIWQLLVPFARNLAQALGLHHPIYVNLVLLLFLLFACLISGILVRAQSVDRAKNWLEDHVLLMIPGYQYIRMRLIATFAKDKQTIPKTVSVSFDDYTAVGLLIEQTEEGKSLVFLPGVPDFSSGDMVIVDTGRVLQLTVSMNEMSNIVRSYGKGVLRKVNFKTTETREQLPS